MWRIVFRAYVNIELPQMYGMMERRKKELCTRLSRAQSQRERIKAERKSDTRGAVDDERSQHKQHYTSLNESGFSIFFIQREWKILCSASLSLSVCVLYMFMASREY